MNHVMLTCLAVTDRAMKTDRNIKVIPAVDGFRSRIPRLGHLLILGVLLMFVKFTKDVPGSAIKSGSVSEHPDAIGRAYIEGGYGIEIDAMTVLRAEQASMFGDMEGRLTKAMTDAVKPAKSNPPSYSRSLPDGSLEIEGELRGGEASAERNTRGKAIKGPTPGDITRALYWAKADLVEDHRITERMQEFAKGQLRRWQQDK